MTEHLTTVETFFKRWGTSYEEFCQSFLDTFAEDGTWIAGPGIPATTGGAEAVALLEQFKAGYNMGACSVEMLKISQDGDTVWTERLDTILDADGAVIVAIPVAGVLTLNDAGKIASYVDYWDMQELQSKAVTG